MHSGGCVYLVGAGPGDPDLLTLKAHKLISQADAVVYDRLVGEGVLALIPANAERVFVGKETGRHPVPQDEINEILVSLARRCRRVVRLKGGDPTVFGRGGEEALYLARHGVACEVVPGISAAVGCAAAAGIPLTHRGLANSVRFLTGHLQNNGKLDLDWDLLADPNCTLVIYMGLGALPVIAESLIKAGLSAQTPACAIENGTTPQQRVITAPLAQLPEKATAAGLKPPTLIVIGEVVGLVPALSLRSIEKVHA